MVQNFVISWTEHVLSVEVTRTLSRNSFLNKSSLISDPPPNEQQTYQEDFRLSIHPHLHLHTVVFFFWRNKFLIKSKPIPTNGSDMSCYLVQLIFTFPQLICLQHQSSLCRLPGPLSPPPSYRECCLTSQSNPPR